MEIRIIPAIPKEQREMGRTLRVAAYARVSTDHEEQESSYEAQVTHFTELIRAHSNWTLAGIYADEGISATTTTKREDFMRLIGDCERGRVDLVLTKSISRWARNTLDSLQYIRRLKNLGIPVIFEKEGVNTMETSGELLVTILSSIAQQESKSVSDNVRLGIQYGFQRGKPMINTTHFLGYDKDEAGNLVINPGEAVLVRRIFRMYVDGMTPTEIAHKLEEKQIPSPGGGSKWYDSTILSMLKNEKYQGDLRLQKSYTVDFLEKKRSKNRGELPQYYVEGAHDPIVPRGVFSKVQAMMGRKKGLVVCGICGEAYYRDRAKGRKSVWRHAARPALSKEVGAGGDWPCPGKPISVEEVEGAVVNGFKRLPEYETFLREHGTGQEAVNAIVLINSSTSGPIKDGLSVDRPEEPPSCSDVGDFYAWTETHTGITSSYDDFLARKYISSIEIFPTRIEVVFKCGVRIVTER